MSTQRVRVAENALDRVVVVDAVGARHDVQDVHGLGGDLRFELGPDMPTAHEEADVEQGLSEDSERWLGTLVEAERRHIERVMRYEFGTRTAQFQVCTDCGVVPLVTSLIEKRLYAVVSVNAFDNIAPSQLKRMPASFDGESEGDRLARRQRNWIGDVEIAAPC